jgi:uncharacterized SAM-binding protein YcdF (DUF218 family)
VTYTQPLLAVFLTIAVAALLGLPNRRRRMIAGVGVGGLFLLSWPPAAWLFSRPLEARYEIRPFAANSGLEGVVVFSEDIEPAHFERPYAVPGQNTFERCLYAAWIYHRYGPLPVLVSGGPMAAGLPPGARTMKELLVANGVPERMITAEEQSHSTHENGLFSSVILRQRGISRVTLVVDATSMPRAAACFRKAGIEVVPAPSSFYQLGPMPGSLLPGWRAIRQNEETLHEALGLLWYRLRGWV